MSHRILIVDDIPQNIQVLGTILRNNGYEISYASNGLKALERIHALAFDLILLDVMMPGMSGYDLCETIKRIPEYKDVPIIFITAKTEPDSIVHGFKIGGVDYITKPFNEAELLARVHNHLCLKDSRDELKRHRELLQESNQTKDKLFSIISHDLTNALHYIQMAIETMLLEKEVNGVISVDKLFKMNETVERVISLLTNLIQWAHSQTGKITNHAEDLDLNLMIDEVVHLFQPNLEKKEIHLSLESQDDVRCFADRNLTLSVLRNLLSNAIKFTPHYGTITLRVNSFTDRVVLTIEDSGVGIPADVIEQLFKPNFHLTTKGTEKEKGTGLGLLICKEFIDKIGGQIKVTSVEGKGSRFTFTLPVKEDV